jgi:S-DNA-T family DNA segregation ATPase FtsK/SpoIIIE
MGRKKKKIVPPKKQQTKKTANEKESRSPSPYHFSSLHPDIQRSVWIVILIGIGIIFLLAGFGQAGPWGEKMYAAFKTLFGWGYYFIPAMFFLIAFSFLSDEREKFFSIATIAAVLFVISGLGLIDIIAPGSGGIVGAVIGSIKKPFGMTAGLVIALTMCIASFVITVNRPFNFIRPKTDDEDEKEKKPEKIEVKESLPPEPIEEASGKKKKEELVPVAEPADGPEKAMGKTMQKNAKMKNYVAPPLSLLSSTVDKPTAGDLQANANIIKRTFDSFGIAVEMGEINVGPTVTRYTLKPAEGTRLSRITALHQDLALALAAHPIRIEAPIPGKSLVGLEVPNKAAAIVRLGSLLLYPDFQKTGNLSFALGRSVSGDPMFPDVAKMPHLLIAGATGSGKSITVHSLLISLLYKNSPEMLGLILIDPKRVELSIYDGIPHLLAPVITDTKKSMGALKWAIDEMDRRYQILLEHGCRDIKSYHKDNHDLPYIVIVIDELADLMQTYGREVEGSIIRLAQMARATGIHLVLSTQRPSVEVITGLIKVNITTRIALQVASQIDSRTILDTSGAEKLLGKGDLLFTSAELSKPRRLQGTFVTEDEIKAVLKFIRENNKAPEQDIVGDVHIEDGSLVGAKMLSFENYGKDDDEDELYEEAVEVIRQAGKASTSFLQRRLKVGYARAARLIDMMEERGVVGPGEGAKPRDVLL